MALRNSPKENVEGFSYNDLVLGQPIRIPGDFFDKSSDTDIPDNCDLIVTKFVRYVNSLRFMSPRENKRNSYLEKSYFFMLANFATIDRQNMCYNIISLCWLTSLQWLVKMCYNVISLCWLTSLQ